MVQIEPKSCPQNQIEKLLKLKIDIKHKARTANRVSSSYLEDGYSATLTERIIFGTNMS